ncbi:MAG: transposase [Patescibacteria group bacterium]
MTLRTINIPGHAYFVTSKVYQNQNIFVHKKFCEIIITNLKFYRKSKNFKLLGYVIMPNHLHTVIWPLGKYSISDILRDFKKQTAKEIITVLREGGIQNPAEIANPGEVGICNPAVMAGRIQNPTFSELLNVFTVNSKKQTCRLWQSRNWIENIYSKKFLAQKLNYIHNNPVRAKMVKQPENYQYSSFRHYFPLQINSKRDCLV